MSKKRPRHAPIADSSAQQQQLRFGKTAAPVLQLCGTARDRRPCPLGCGSSVLLEMMNLHMDMCLLNQERVEGQRQAVAVSESQHLTVVECPLGCGTMVSPHEINSHIDECLLILEKRSTESKVSNHGSNNGTGSPVSHSNAVQSSSHIKNPGEKLNDSSSRELNRCAVAKLLCPLQPFTSAPNFSCPREVPGLILIRDFISEAEETELVQSIDSDMSTPWKHSSFNGHCMSKCYGLKTEFGIPGRPEPRGVRVNNPALGEHDIPDFLLLFPLRLHEMVNKLDQVPLELKHFVPNECNCNSYEAAEKHSLRPHFDDRALSGPLLMNLSLSSDARMTYISAKNEETLIYLPRRCLQIVIGPARWVYRHSIKASDVLGPRRVSVTWRQAGGQHKGIRQKRKTTA